MGTLTGDLPRLAEHCPHKLPTSCRLTSTPQCCACYDRREHTLSYRKYIDGVGFVYRGTRWQDYCWFCKEFWENRVLAAGLRPQDTRIPHHPDQEDFVAEWFDLHRGYRFEIQDGREGRVELPLADLWRDVEPGHLPITVEQFSQGVTRTQYRQIVHARRSENAQEPVQSIESALDELLQDAENEESGNDNSTQLPRRGSEEQPQDHRDILLVLTAHLLENPCNHFQGLRDDLQDFRVSLLQSEQPLPDIVAEFRSSISHEGLRAIRDDLASFSDHDLSLTFINQLRDLIIIVEPHPDTLLDVLRHTEEQQNIARQRRAQRNERQRIAFTRLFGTREEVEAQGENYQSPISGMYQRAWERYRAAEEARQAGPAATEITAASTHPSLRVGDGVQLYYFNDGTVAPMTEELPELAERAAPPPRQASPSPERGLDIDDGRPEAIPRVSMVRNMECKVCYQQLASEALLPCGHLAMCQWCADQAVPFRNGDDRSGNVGHGVVCPSCRRRVRRRVRIFF